MLDIKFIRQNPELIKQAVQKKHVDFDVNRLIAVDARRRELLESSESLKFEQNKRSKGPQSPKDLDLVDVERGAKVSGFRGYFLKNEAVILSFALWQLAMEQLLKKCFQPLIAPAIAKEFKK